MGISIKNPEAERLIRELAEATGQSQVDAVIEAVKEKLESLDRRGVAERLMAIARETAPLLAGLDMDEAMYGENGLYDRETGLPK